MILLRERTRNRPDAANCVINHFSPEANIIISRLPPEFNLIAVCCGWQESAFLQLVKILSIKLHHKSLNRVSTFLSFLYANIGKRLVVLILRTRFSNNSCSRHTFYSSENEADLFFALMSFHSEGLEKFSFVPFQVKFAPTLTKEGIRQEKNGETSTFRENSVPLGKLILSQLCSSQTNYMVERHQSISKFHSSAH